MNDDLDIEHTATAVVEHALEVFAADAAFRGMVDAGVVVDVLAFAAGIDTIQADFGVFTDQAGIGVDAGQTAAEVETVVMDAAVTRLLAEECGHMITMG